MAGGSGTKKCDSNKMTGDLGMIVCKVESKIGNLVNELFSYWRLETMQLAVAGGRSN